MTRENIQSIWPSQLMQMSQKTTDIEQMLGHFWPTVYDADPTMTQHLVNVSCLQGILRSNHRLYCMRFLCCSGVFCEENLSVCSSRPCMNNGKCQDIAGSGFLCACNPDTTGPLCEQVVISVKSSKVGFNLEEVIGIVG